MRISHSLINSKKKKRSGADDRYYSALGFVEALIAIAVTGIACLVFMDVTAQSMVELIRLEQHDKLTRESSVVAEKVHRIIAKQNAGAPNVFPDPMSNNGKCFKVSGTTNDPAFSPITSICTTGNLEGCKSSFSGELFTVYCIKKYDSSSGLVKGEVISGLLQCQVRKNGECIVRDHSITVIGRLE